MALLVLIAVRMKKSMRWMHLKMFFLRLSADSLIYNEPPTKLISKRSQKLQQARHKRHHILSTLVFKLDSFGPDLLEINSMSSFIVTRSYDIPSHRGKKIYTL